MSVGVFVLEAVSLVAVRVPVVVVPGGCAVAGVLDTIGGVDILGG